MMLFTEIVIEETTQIAKIGLVNIVVDHTKENAQLMGRHIMAVVVRTILKPDVCTSPRKRTNMIDLKRKCDKCCHFKKKIESVDCNYESDESYNEDDQMDDLADQVQSLFYH